MSYVVIARWKAMEGEADAIADLARGMVAPSRAEPGNLLYQPHRSSTDPNVFVFYEQYVDEEAYLAHQNTTHFKHIVELGIPRLESREREFFDTDQL